MLRGVIFAGVLAALFAGTAGADEALRRQAASLFGEIKPSTAAASPQAELGRRSSGTSGHRSTERPRARAAISRAIGAPTGGASRPTRAAR